MKSGCLNSFTVAFDFLNWIMYHSKVRVVKNREYDT